MKYNVKLTPPCWSCDCPLSTGHIWLIVHTRSHSVILLLDLLHLTTRLCFLHMGCDLGTVVCRKAWESRCRRTKICSRTRTSYLAKRQRRIGWISRDRNWIRSLTIWIAIAWCWHSSALAVIGLFSKWFRVLLMIILTWWLALFGIIVTWRWTRYIAPKTASTWPLRVLPSMVYQRRRSYYPWFPRGCYILIPRISRWRYILIVSRVNRRSNSISRCRFRCWTF